MIAGSARGTVGDVRGRWPVRAAARSRRAARAEVVRCADALDGDVAGAADDPRRDARGVGAGPGIGGHIRHPVAREAPLVVGAAVDLRAEHLAGRAAVEVLPAPVQDRPPGDRAGAGADAPRHHLTARAERRAGRPEAARERGDLRQRRGARGRRARRLDDLRGREAAAGPAELAAPVRAPAEHPPAAEPRAGVSRPSTGRGRW